MARNDQNLIPLNKRPEAEARKIQSMGGKASAEARKKQKLFRECLEDVLALPCSDIRRFNKLCRMGVDPETINNKMVLAAAVYNTAVRDGDINALDKIRAILGEDNTPNDDTIAKLDEVLDKIGGEI